MIDNKKVVAVTLARGGSKGIPRKNIIPICGKPLLTYTIDQVLKSKYIDKYIISTDDEEIENLATCMNISVRQRPDELASDGARSSDAVIDAIQNMHGYEYVVEIMCTNPLKISADIDGCIYKLHTSGADSVVSVVRIYDHHPSRAKYIEDDLLHDFYPEIPESRRQDLVPHAFVRNGSIYATTWKSLLSTGVRLGPVTRPYIMPEERTINIDEPIDVLVAEQLIQQRN